MDSTTRRLGVLCLAVLAAAITACGGPGATQCETTGILCPADTHCAAAQPICLANSVLCGNAQKDGAEECDDGNVMDGDGCSHDCRIERCGNGVMDPGEVCDLGEGKNGACGGCAADCKSFEQCGDGVVDKACNEVCDDHNTEGGDGCAANCKSTEVCGNGITDTEVGEVCDDGDKNGTPGDKCSPNCRSNLSCNNGTIDPGEECDNGTFGAGNMTGNDNGNDCRADCQFNRCGDGFVDAEAGTRHEQCDRGHLVGLVPVPTEEVDCNIDCTAPSCGDGKINRHFSPSGVGGPTEQCDDAGGNNNNADCTVGCQINVCGDGFQDITGAHPEDCDDGALNGSAASNCTKTCHLASCGNGVVEQHEECDDGAGNGADKRCNDSCKFNVCGDGHTFTGVEQCDGGLAGTPRDTSTCNIDCTLSVCGDGHINTQAGEVCDDGAMNGTLVSLCSTSCKPIHCGNGFRDQNEACDAGNGTPQDSATCDSDCTLASCGDGHINMAAGENCDDGPNNGISPSLCSTTCKTIRCGNGIKEQGEDCDDGDANNGAGKRCNASCKLNVCGDGDMLVGVEQCDEGLNGTRRDTLHCDDDCTLPVCGDHHRNSMAGEDCDDGIQNGTGATTCDAVCKTSSCGNGIVDPGEQCDSGVGGVATASATCNIDCTFAFCGDGKINAAAGEVCDNIGLNGVPCDYNNPTCMRCSADCKHSNATPGGPFCGDGIAQASFSEQCDPGGGIVPADSSTCDSDCTHVSCGDGHVNTVTEGCDDGNSDACGTCPSTTCVGSAVAAAKAGGSIKAAAALAMSGNIADGDTFTLNDGFNPAVVFEFDVGGGGTVGTGHVKITLVGDGSEDAAAVATKMRAAITSPGVGNPLDITAVVGGSGGDTVVLTNNHKSALGNKPIGHSGTIDTSFVFTSFTGGLAGDCLTGTGCLSDADCKLSCNLTVTPHVCL